VCSSVELKGEGGGEPTESFSSRRRGAKSFAPKEERATLWHLLAPLDSQRALASKGALTQREKLSTFKRADRWGFYKGCPEYFKKGRLYEKAYGG